jgi:hypothetical protein
MKISELIDLLGKYNGALEISTVKNLPTSSDFDNELFTKFGLEMDSSHAPEIIGSILELDLVVLKYTE